MQVGISDIRNIVKKIKEVHNIDFSNYALTSFKRRIEKYLDTHRLTNINTLINKITSDRMSFQIFLQDISIPDTEMFRDPSYWKIFRDQILPGFLHQDEFNIWIASSTTGEELYSLCIILKEEHLLKNAKIFATNISQRNIDLIRNGIYDLKKMEMNEANYERYEGKYNLKDYYKTYNNKAHMDTSLIENVKFINFDITKDEFPYEVEILFIRNMMLYFNRYLQNLIIQGIDNKIKKGGFLTLGVKENITENNISSQYIKIHNEENIFKKF